MNSCLNCGDKRDYYKIISVSKGTRVDRDFYHSLYAIGKPLIESNELSLEQKQIVMSLILNSYQSEYRYENAEEVAIKLEELGCSKWNSAYALGEFYTFTRRYEKAKKILEDSLKVINNEEIKKIISEKLEDCINRQSGKKKEYLPASNEAKEKYKAFLKSLCIEIALPPKKDKNPKEILKEDYPDIIETKNTNFNEFISFDFETTGFATYDEIIEIGAVKVVEGEVIERFESLVKTRRKLSNRITEITGITDNMLVDAPYMEEVLPKFIEFIGDKVLLGHNVVKFDSKFLMRAGRKHGIIIKNPIFDVMTYSKKIDPIKKLFKKNNLNTLCESLGVVNNQAHRALADAEATAKVYLQLLNIDNTKKSSNSIDDMLDEMDEWL